MAKILLVDDERTVHDLVTRVVTSKTAHTVTTALSAWTALDALAAGRYDLALVDLHMPDCDGKEFVRRMRAAGHDLPVVILSGLPEGEIEAAAAAVGARDWISKPFEMDRLLEACIEALDGPGEDGGAEG